VAGPRKRRADRDGGAFARQAWKLTNIIWCVFTRALLPITVDQLVEAVPNLLEHLERTDSRAGRKQRDEFLRKRCDRIHLHVAA